MGRFMPPKVEILCEWLVMSSSRDATRMLVCLFMLVYLVCMFFFYLHQFPIYLQPHKTTPPKKILLLTSSCSSKPCVINLSPHHKKNSPIEAVTALQGMTCISLTPLMLFHYLVSSVLLMPSNQHCLI